eukprot:9129280-Prorocentrum_lima.AAC.1
MVHHSAGCMLHPNANPKTGEGDPHRLGKMPARSNQPPSDCSEDAHHEEVFHASRATSAS